METRRREKWFMMDADGWSILEVKVKGEMCLCVCVCLSVFLYLHLSVDRHMFLTME